MDNVLKFAPFDFCVVRFIWGPGDGDDLDTRTQIVSPSLPGAVGWSRNGTLHGGALIWGGDNTGSGLESVLIDFPTLTAAYPTESAFEVSLRAFWYDQRLGGSVAVRFETYSGGVMQQDGFGFENVGGELVQTQTIYKNVVTEQGDDIDGELIGTITYNPSTRSASIK